MAIRGMVGCMEISLIIEVDLKSRLCVTLGERKHVQKSLLCDHVTTYNINQLIIKGTYHNEIPAYWLHTSSVLT